MTEMMLKLPDEIYQQIKADAKSQHLTPEDYVVNILKETMAAKFEDTFEARQFQAKRIPGRKFNREHELVLVDGINYRYRLADGNTINSTSDYMVIGAKGNVLIIKQVGTSQTS